ncbi:MAG: hypothetical protein ACRDDZ_05485 [Marinifilaceae bacterium]
MDNAKLGLQWQWNHNPNIEGWSLKERKGYMRLKAAAGYRFEKTRNTLTQRVQGSNSERAVKMNVS